MSAIAEFPDLNWAVDVRHLLWLLYHNNITIREFARQSDISGMTIYRALRGQACSPITILKIGRACKYYGFEDVLLAPDSYEPAPWITSIC